MNTTLIAIRAFFARTDFSTYIAECFDNVRITHLILIAVFGIGLSAMLFLQRSFIYRRLAWTTTVCTILLLIGDIFWIDLLMYLVVGVLVVCLVLHQQELRELLIKVLGSRAFSTKREVAVVDQHRAMIDAVCQTAVELSRSGTGALIVLERNIKLDDIARSGVELDAKATPYLLRNIFFDKAPLHDGAVILRNCRVWAASAILPLTSRLDIEQDLGTRHRAAIGLSEICDAVVVVVSEETGIISVAHNSELLRDFSFQSLHAYLTKNLLHEKEEEEAGN